MSFFLDRCSGLPEVRLEPGTVFLSEGTKSGKLYILIEGEVEISRADVEVASVSEPGAIFGEMSILLDAPHTASAKALSESRLYLVENAETFLASAPDVLHQVGRVLALRLQSATEYLADLKRQYAESSDHLGMVDQVLESLLHQQDVEFTAGSDREIDPRL